MPTSQNLKSTEAAIQTRQRLQWREKPCAHVCTVTTFSLVTTTLQNSWSPQEICSGVFVTVCTRHTQSQRNGCNEAPSTGQSTQSAHADLYFDDHQQHHTPTFILINLFLQTPQQLVEMESSYTRLALTLTLTWMSSTGQVFCNLTSLKKREHCIHLMTFLRPLTTNTMCQLLCFMWAGLN